MKHIYLIISLLITFSSLAQKPLLYSGPKLIEKGYLHTDRSFYFPGETIWFKGYITQGKNIPAPISDYAYVHLISPDGSIAQKGTYKIENGTIYGEFSINQNWIGGSYKLKVFTKWMLNDLENESFIKNITVQNLIPPKFQMKFDFLKEAYGPGSEVIATLELKDLENVLLSNINSRVSVTINGQEYLKKMITSDNGGIVHIAFDLPEDLTTTDILINCVTTHNGSTESISRSVPVILDSIDLQWFPESGVFLQDISNKLAFKAVNEYGKPADVKGHIKNNKGVIIAQFDSFHDGMGSVIITPRPNEKYTAHITDPIQSKKEYLLPQSEKEGVLLQLNRTTVDTAYFTLKSSGDFSGLLTATEAQKTIYSRPLNIHRGTQKIEIPIESCKKGIIKFTVQTDDCKYISERLVFLHYDKKLKLHLTTNKQKYGTREKTIVEILSTDQDNNPIPANLSLSAVNSRIISFADDKQDNILSYFLISSELKGTIYKPNFYFDPKEEPKAQIALDNVLLTHGWRKHMYQSITDVAAATYPPEKSGLKMGQVLDKQGKGIKATVLVFETSAQRALPIETNDHGYFSFNMDTANYVMLAAYNASNDKLTIQMDSSQRGRLFKPGNSGENAEVPQRKNFLLKPSALKKEEIVKTMKNSKITLNSDNSLDEVIVTAQGIKREKKALGYAVSSVASEKLSIAGDAARVLSGKASGVAITSTSGSSGASTNVIIRGYNSISGNNQALFIVDGIPFSTDSSVNEVSLSNIDPSQIESVHVLKGLAAATLYGSQGRNGVIVISTKKSHYGRVYGMKRLGNKKYKNYATQAVYNNGLKTITKSTLFYTPIYDSKKIPKERTDFRQTLYWNPIIETNKDGEASISFYNTDETTAVTLTAEGLSPTGNIGRSTHEYAIQKPVSIDFKIPPYLSEGDEITIEMIIQNNSDKDVTGIWDVLFPKEITFSNDIPTSEIKIQNNSFKKVFLNISPNAPLAQGEIKARFKTDKGQDILIKPIEIISPYFPIATSINGTKSDNYYFDIDNAVPKSIKGDLSIYTDVVGDVMDGVASMLREPHGCFEQTSSSTYPNVMVLQYLRESGKTNTDIEEKALNYIAKGYNRLISFETSEGGFEWFGKTPPHETLTAYGILEFTEMQNVYPRVSQKMIDRTVQWLMSRRNGQGGFKKSKKGYDSFASSPEDVANAYILYALSESGHFKNLDLEYNTAYLDSKSSNDAYKLAIMANTAHNINQLEHYNQLVEQLQTILEAYDMKELPIKNTITRSYGKAKQIETLSFAALALLKSNDSDQVVLSKIIETILSYRSNNRFGSTQSTVMAIKALIEYTRLKKRTYLQGENILFTINDHQLPLQLENAINGKLSIKNLANYLQEGENSIQVKYSNPKNTVPYNLNIQWLSTKPANHEQPMVAVSTTIDKDTVSLGDTIRETIKVTNLTNDGLGMITSIIGVPAGTSAQPWQLKELMETNQIAFYEVYDNFVIFYWRSFKAQETKVIHLDLKSEIKGTFKAAASNAYPYYGDEMKYWTAGTEVTIF